MPGGLSPPPAYEREVNRMRTLVALVALIAILFAAVPAFAAEPGQEGLTADRPSWIILPGDPRSAESL